MASLPDYQTSDSLTSSHPPAQFAFGRRQFLRLTLATAGASLLAACGSAQSPPAPSISAGAASAAGSALASASQAANGSATAAGSQPAQKAPKTGGTFLVAHHSDLLFGGDVFRSTLSDNTGVTGALNGVGNLVKYSREDIYKVAPGLAESWESNPTFTEWTFKIRDNAKWHDGTPFTAQDAKWWLDLAISGARSGDKIRPPAPWAGNLGPVDGVEALDGNHVRLRLKTPKAQLLTLLGDPIQQIAHPRHLMQPKIDQGQTDVTPADVGFVSVGPFKMLKYDKGSRIQLKRNDLYWEKDAQGRPLPYLDGIDYPIIPDPSSMDYAIINGQLDGGARGKDHLLTQARLDQYKKALGDKVQFVSVGFSSLALIINTLKPGPFQDARVRQAVELWVDKAAYGTVIGGLTYQQTLLNPKNPFSSPDFQTWPGWNLATRDQDKAKAKQLMSDAGYASGFDTTLLVRSDVQQNGVFFQGQLAGLGIRAKLDITDTAGQQQRAQARNYVLFSNAAPNPLIPEATASLLNAASKAPGGGLGAAHEDPKVADYYAQLDAATDTPTRIRIWRELEKYLLVDQAYVVTADAQYRTIGYRSYVQGLYPPPENQYQNLDFATVWLDK